MGDRWNEVARVLVTVSLDRGGVTLNADGDEFAGGGFAVGGAVPGIAVPADEPMDRLVGRVRLWLGRAAGAVSHVGGWVNDGTLYVDGSDIFADRDTALGVCRRRGELAMYDLGNGAEVACG